jgi:hypothetical protein
MPVRDYVGLLRAGPLGDEAAAIMWACTFHVVDDQAGVSPLWLWVPGTYERYDLACWLL